MRNKNRRGNGVMAVTSIAGVLRAGAYSPNHIGNDAAIFHAVADELRKRGYKVNIYSEKQFRDTDIKEPVIVGMCRESATLDKLQTLEDQGRLVINSGYGIANCARARLTGILQGNAIPMPESYVVDTNESVKALLDEKGLSSCWIKRGDCHAMHKEDISFCRHPEEAQEVLREYFYRGIPRAVISRHVAGDLVKFYGVVGEDFFYWFYPYDIGVAQLGVEQVSGRSQGTPFDEEALKQVCRKAAGALGVTVYGGDCIVEADGSFKIISFNDWPSFAPCRQAAAPWIAKKIAAGIRGLKS